MDGPQNDQRRTSVTVKSAIKVLTIVTLTAVLTFLCIIWYRQSAGKIPSVVANYKNQLLSVGERPDKYWISNRSTNIGLDQNHRNGQLRSSTHQNRALPPVNVGVKFINKSLLPTNHKYSDGVFVKDRNDEDETKTDQDIIKQKNRYDYSNTEMERWISSHGESTNNHGTYDLTYNAGENRQSDHPTGENILNVYPATELGSYGPHFSPPAFTQNTNIEQASTINHLPYSTNNIPSTKNYPPPIMNYHTHPSKNYQPPGINNYPPFITNYQSPTSANHPSPQQKLLVPIPEKSEFDWQFYGKLALIKLVLFKLKAFGIFNILLFLLFKLKLFLIAVFFKFLMLSKFVAIFKTVVSPLFVLSLFPILLVAIFSIPARLLQSLFSTPLLPTAIPMISTPLTLIPSIQATSRPILRPSFQTSAPSILNRPGTLANTVIPSQPGTLTPSRPAALPLLRPPNGKTVTGNNLGFRAYKTNGLNVLYRGYNESLVTKQLVLDIFGSVFDSEKCVEKIACHMAVTEKTGVMPLWINWVLHGVSKFIPDEELESFFKTYRDVQNEVSDYLPNPENWNKWCSERYNCNVTNATRHKIDIKQ